MLGQSNLNVVMGKGHPIHSHDVNRCMGTGCFANDTLQKKKFCRFSLSPPELLMSADYLHLCRYLHFSRFTLQT